MNCALPVVLVLVATAATSAPKPADDGFVLVKPGTFVMGTGATPVLAISGEEAVEHKVTLTHAISVAKGPTTQEEFKKLMGRNPSTNPVNGVPHRSTDAKYDEKKFLPRPVEHITWFDAVEYCNKLSKSKGLEPAYVISGKDVRPNGPSVYETKGYKEGRAGYRLPTEAEREYFTRAGTTTMYWFGGDELTRDEQAKFLGPQGGWKDDFHEAGKAPANPWGLFDVVGNVFEWTNDWYVDSYAADAVSDPTGPESGERRVVRGSGTATETRSTNRRAFLPDDANVGVGMRVVRSVGPSGK